MPWVKIEPIEGVFSDQQKREMTERVTAGMVYVEGARMRSVTWVTLDYDVRSGELGDRWKEPDGRGREEPGEGRRDALFTPQPLDHDPNLLLG